MATDLSKDLVQQLEQQIKTFDTTPKVTTVGEVIEIGDGIARVSGLTNVKAQELVEFDTGTQGVAFNLEDDQGGVIIMGDYGSIQEGSQVRALNRLASVPVSAAMLGRVVDPLGLPLDGKGPIAVDTYMDLERIAPGVVERRNVDTPLMTGLKAIDAMIPIGRGQRQLIIGDRQTGKTAICVDAIINQKDTDVICIYVAIGQKKAQVARVLGTLERYGAMDYTIIVNASASESAALQYFAPYAGCAIGEYFMEKGQHVLVIYDDLSKHAWAYREVSLLMRRPPGREAYPGDVFYLHSRLLERAAQLSEERGNGSLTALPIIETLLGDVSAYVPTNVISITDGQIYLENDLFYAGIRPAINTGISVSRVGGDAQRKAMKQVAGSLRLDMAQFRSLEAFAQFGSSDLDKSTRDRLERGLRLQELLKQQQYAPFSFTDQVVSLYAGTRGHLDDIPVERVAAFEEEFLTFVKTSYPDLLTKIDEVGRLNDEIEERLKTAIDAFKSTFS
ncbi:MAG: F0F1 ATP synthase subunit alpha [Chloroflexi bacterium]|nr:F0F1 ATP synthase subunit alpha [Chloroflexota bacterium]